MEKQLKLGCVILENNVVKRIETAITKLHYDIKLYSFRRIDQLENCIPNNQIDYVLIDIDINKDEILLLLEKLKNDFPLVVRVLLSDSMSNELVLMTNNMVHLILDKKNLEHSLNNLFLKAKRLRAFLQNKDLIRMANAFNNLVVINPQHLEILSQINNEAVPRKELAKLIERNIALSTKVLQVANMTTFASTVKIQSVPLAVFFLGDNILRAIVLNMQIYSVEKGKEDLYKQLILLEQHCIKIADLSRNIAETFESGKSLLNDSFTAGLLHDIGKLVIIEKVSNWDSIMRLSTDGSLIIWKAEEAFLGANHAQIGAYFLGIWNFPEEIIDAVAYHHHPSISQKDYVSPLTFVHIAESMLSFGNTVSFEEFTKQLDMEYLEKLGIKEKTINYYRKFVEKIDEINESISIEIIETTE